MINFFKKINTNIKSKKLVHNVLEPMLGKGIDYCKGTAEANDFYLTEEESDRLMFVRQDITQKLILTLNFDEENNCRYYMLIFKNPGESVMQSQSLDSHSVREHGLVED